MKTEKITTKPPFPELRGTLTAMTFPALSEIKYDGEYTMVIYKDERQNDAKACYTLQPGNITCKTLNKYGRTRTHFPAIDAIARDCHAHGVREAVFLAELYALNGKLGALYDLNSMKEDDSLSLFVFDCSRIIFHDNSEYDDVAPTDSLIDRKETIMNILPSQRSQLKIVMNETEALEHFNEVVADGYEGTVIKPLDGRLIMGPCPWVKVKFKDQNNYPVVLIDPYKERVEVLVTSSDGFQPRAVNVGVKVMNADKNTLKVGDVITVEHQGILPGGSLRHPVFKGKV